MKSHINKFERNGVCFKLDNNQEVCIPRPTDFIFDNDCVLSTYKIVEISDDAKGLVVQT